MCADHPLGVNNASAGRRTLGSKATGSQRETHGRVRQNCRVTLVSEGEVVRASEGQVPMNRPLAILLAMAMFVLVVDTSIMNVSISAVVRDLDTTVSGVQSAIALEALV